MKQKFKFKTFYCVNWDSAKLGVNTNQLNRLNIAQYNNTTQRNATQRNATQRNATQLLLLLLTYCIYKAKKILNKLLRTKHLWQH